MTQTAKTLVFVNLVLSIVFLAWAVGLFTNEVPWHSPPPGDGPKVEGMIAQLQARIKELTDARDPADQRWGMTYKTVQDTEIHRADAQKYYAALLGSIRTGDVPEIKPPVQELAFNGPALDIKKLNGRPPVTINGENALSIAGYHARIQQTIKDYQTAQATIDQLGRETKALTEQINGVTPGIPRAPTLAEKGLRVQIREQQDLVHGLQLEEQYLRSPLTYYTLQREQLRQRQAALANRLGELKPAVTAAR
jgi:hypothetical protein